MRVRHQIGARPVEAELGERADQHAAADRDHHQHGQMPLALQDQEAHHSEAHQGQDAEAAERREVAHQVLEPAGAEGSEGRPRWRSASRIGLVEGMGLAFEHLVGQLAEQHQAGGRQRDGSEQRQPRAAPSATRRARVAAGGRGRAARRCAAGAAMPAIAPLRRPLEELRSASMTRI